jgi:uncharacterized protein with HEPN domain
MSHDILKLIVDIFDSIELIEEYFRDIPNLSSYEKDKKTIDAVERRLAIIGEALWKADKKDKELVISDKNKIIALRYILVHDYDLMEDEMVWIICKKNLPILKSEVQVILNSK